MAKCLECGNEFEAASVRAKFCSIACKSSFHRKVIVSDIVSETVIVSEESDDDVGTPAKVLDLAKDLHLNLQKDLGVTA